MAAPRKPPPAWWLLGYLAQYQRHALLDALAKAGLASDDVYLAARQAAEHLPAVPYRGFLKAGQFGSIAHGTHKNLLKIAEVIILLCSTLRQGVVA